MEEDSEEVTRGISGFSGRTVERNVLARGLPLPQQRGSHFHTCFTLDLQQEQFPPQGEEGQEAKGWCASALGPGRERRAGGGQKYDMPPSLALSRNSE